MNLRLIDIGLATILLWSGIKGYSRGFLLELFSVASFALAGLISVKLLDPIVAVCVQWSADWSKILPYIISIFIFFFTVIGIDLLGRLLKRLIKPTLLGSIDKLAGSMLGMLKWGLLISTCLWIAKYLLQLEIPVQYTEHTIIFPVVERIAPQCLRLFLTIWITPRHVSSLIPLPT
ncbi:MAG: CvpA family protein [Bacteroidota bacterium]